jgi:transcriptional regulator with XRE-family HTH domain
MSGHLTSKVVTLDMLDFIPEGFALSAEASADQETSMARHSYPERAAVAAMLGMALREARNDSGLTQLELAGRVGIVSAIVTRLERGHMLPSLLLVRRLCMALQADANTLLGLSPAKPAPRVSEQVTIPTDSPQALKGLVHAASSLSSEHLRLLRVLAQELAAKKHPAPSQEPAPEQEPAPG